ncbi:hypothetical protein [Novosphingobium sp.]|uniref:DUF6998 domain-containing protein n=1 Tax=Novosphingobium sp. TaxID=1874826 RepID=UPI00262D2E16|nr:hypothetical protein [Novosphingobium sp.]
MHIGGLIKQCRFGKEGARTISGKTGDFTGQSRKYDPATERRAFCSMIEPPRRVVLPAPVAKIYEAVEELSRLYPGRPFTPDGHLVGSIGEVIAAEALGLTLYPPSQPGHDAFDEQGDIQIKMTAGKAISMYATCDRLVVLRVVTPHEAEIVYDGPGAIAWESAGPMAKNGQRRISLSRLKTLAQASNLPDEGGTNAGF